MNGLGHPKQTTLQTGMRFWKYVYELVDPRDGKPFYIGSGTHKRMYFHEKEAEFGMLTRKCARIREIWSDGLVVEKRIIGLFRHRREASFFELDRIEELGYENLTNGKTGKTVRLT